MAVPAITEAEFQDKVLKSETPVLLDFFAQWCGPCKLAEPVLEELSNEYTGKVSIAKLDVDHNPQVAEQFGVMSIPTTILFKGGQEVGRQVGFAGKQRFVDLIQKAI